MIKPLNPGLIRYPGGSLANTFRWADSIGPLAQRKPVTNFFEMKGEVPLLGFDDFMKFVEQVNAKGAIIIVNCDVWPKNPENSGSAREAAAWVAYANAEVGDRPVPIGKDERGTDWKDSQYWANLRVTNGHPRPYDVLYWEIGNEIYDSKQGAGLTPETYAARVIEFSGLMKQVDPRIKVGVIDWPAGSWGKAPRLVAETPGAADFRIVHSYVSGGKGLFNYQTGFRDTGDREYTFTSSAGKHTLTVVAWARPLKGRPDGKAGSRAGRECDKNPRSPPVSPHGVRLHRPRRQLRALLRPEDCGIRGAHRPGFADRPQLRRGELLVHPGWTVPHS